MYRTRYCEELDLQPAGKKVSWVVAVPLLAIVAGAVWFGASALARPPSKPDATSGRAVETATGPLGANKVVGR